jgi:hypothetical protein
VSNDPGIVRVEGPNDFERRRQYVYSSIVTPNKQIIGSGAYTRDIVLQRIERVSACLKAPENERGTYVNDGGVIVRNLDFRNLKEIERFLLEQQLVCNQDTRNTSHTEVRAISLEPTPSSNDECNGLFRTEASGWSGPRL